MVNVLNMIALQTGRRKGRKGQKSITGTDYARRRGQAHHSLSRLLQGFLPVAHSSKTVPKDHTSIAPFLPFLSPLMTSASNKMNEEWSDSDAPVDENRESLTRCHVHRGPVQAVDTLYASLTWWCSDGRHARPCSESTLILCQNLRRSEIDEFDHAILVEKDVCESATAPSAQHIHPQVRSRTHCQALYRDGRHSENANRPVRRASEPRNIG
jgi:hypothetical protein